MVAVAVEVDVVEQDAEDLPLHRLDLLGGAADHVVGDDADPHDQDHAVALRGERDPVGHGDHRRAVAHDEVEGAERAVEQLAHPLAPDELGGIRRQRPARHQEQVGDARRPRDVRQRRALQQRGGEPAGIVEAEDAVQARAPQIGVDEADARAGLGAHGAEVGDGGRLALAGGGRGDDDAAARLIEARELDIGPQRPVGLGGRRPRVRLGDQARRGVLAGPRRPEPHRLPPNAGTTPITGSPRKRSTSSGVFTDVSK